jgi:MscS family membrane protein
MKKKIYTYTSHPLKFAILTFLLFSTLVDVSAQSEDSLDVGNDSVYRVEDKANVENIKVSFKTVDNSSPRSVLDNFIKNMNESHHFLMKAHQRNMEIPGFFISDEVINDARQSEIFFAKATYCLDLSEIPPSLRKDLGYGRAIMLKEILDRIVLPPLNEIPGYDAIELDLETKKYPKLIHWKIPDTPIILTRIDDGLNEGEYKFSFETIHNLPTFYEQVKGLPYKSDTEITKGFYNFYISTPGLLMPPRWVIYLPEWSTKMYYSQTIWQWLAMAGSFLIALIIIRILNRILIQGKHRFSILIEKWNKAIYYACLITITLFLSSILNEQINITGGTLSVFKIFLESIFWLLLSLLSYNILIAIAEVIITAPKVEKIGIEATYTRASFMVFAILVSVSIIVIGLAQVGVSIVPLLTGVGIGGIAIALAARSTLENIIGSFTIFADKPYRVDDRVRILEYDGTIESIGIRSTQIRLLSGPLVSIPNEKMATVEIENIQARPYIRRDFDIRMKHGSPYQEVEKIVAIIKEILSIPEEEINHPNLVINNHDYPPRVFFNNINTDSFNISVTYWHFPPNWWEFNEHAQAINIKIIQKLNEKGIEFAFPTQKLHVSNGPDTAINSPFKKEKK